MAYIPTVDDINIILQKNQVNYIKILLQDRTFKILEEIQGRLVSDSFNIDATSDIRKTYQIAMYVDDSSFVVGADSYVWLDKVIQVQIGKYYNRDKQIHWYKFGKFLYSDTNYSYSPSTSELTISCTDLMSSFTGDRGGIMVGEVIEINSIDPEDNASLIRNAMIMVVNDIGGYTSYKIEDIGKQIYKDLLFDPGSHIIDIIIALRDLYPGYETFFDENGVFVFQKIPTCEADPVLLTEDVVDKLVIGHDSQNSFTGVFNVTEVIGANLTADRYSELVIYDGSTSIYNITLADLTEFQDNDLIAFKVSDTNSKSKTYAKFAISDDGFASATSYPLKMDDNLTFVPQNKLTSDTSYVFKYISDNLCFLGGFQIRAECSDTNPDSPFYVDKIGELRQVLQGGEYENIVSDNLAMQRAQYENWKTTRLNDSVTLEMISVPWLDVNTKIQYKPPRSDIAYQYIVKSISGSVSKASMTVNMIRFYPLYPEIITPSDNGIVIATQEFDLLYQITGTVSNNPTVYESGVPLQYIIEETDLQPHVYDTGYHTLQYQIVDKYLNLILTLNTGVTLNTHIYLPGKAELHLPIKIKYSSYDELWFVDFLGCDWTIDGTGNPDLDGGSLLYQDDGILYSYFSEAPPPIAISSDYYSVEHYIYTLIFNI